MSSMLVLYGIEVQAGQYHKIKAVADLLVGATSTAVPLLKAQQTCVYIAADAIRRATEIK